MRSSEKPPPAPAGLSPLPLRYTRKPAGALSSPLLSSPSLGIAFAIGIEIEVGPSARPGIRRRTVVFGEQTLMAEFLLTKGSTLPDHEHPYEQTGYLVKGRLRLRVDDDEFDVTPGDSWCIPRDVRHGADVLEDSAAIEVFSPVRADYLPRRT